MRNQATLTLVTLIILVVFTACSAKDTEPSSSDLDAQSMPQIMDTVSAPQSNVTLEEDAAEARSMDTGHHIDAKTDAGHLDAKTDRAAPKGAVNMATLSDYAGPRKKGIAIHQNNYDWSEKVAAVKPFWSYSWALRESRFQPDGIEFVPMKWSGSLSDNDGAYLREKHAAGELKYLLGYNEPDGETQANMSVDRALELWPQLEATGLPLVSPTPIRHDNEWMVEFMRQAGENDLRIDYLAFHWYGGTNALYFLVLLDLVYERYRLPIWITEFAVADWNTNDRELNRIRPESVLDFMRVVLPELDRRDHIVRYAWFNDYSSNSLWPSALFDDEGTLTPLGEFYAEHTPNPAAGPGKPYPVAAADPDNLLGNGGFELGRRAPWGGYEFSVLSIDQAEPHDGAFLGMLRGGFSSAFNQRVTLEAGAIYHISLYSRWSEATDNNVSAHLQVEWTGATWTSAPLHRGTEWQENSSWVIPDATRVYVFWIWTAPQNHADLYVDSISIRREAPNFWITSQYQNFVPLP